jgi:hypothetical protein
MKDIYCKWAMARDNVGHPFIYTLGGGRYMYRTFCDAQLVTRVIWLSLN